MDIKTNKSKACIIPYLQDEYFLNDMLEFLAGLGKALSSTGISVTTIQSILYNVARAYQVKAEILVFTTFIIIKVRDEESSPLTTVSQIYGLSQLNTISELYELIYKVEKAEISPKEGIKCLKKINSHQHRFGKIGMLIGYIFFAVGLGMLLQPTPQQLIASGVLGFLIGILLIFTQNKPRLALIKPVIGSFLISILFFWAVKNGFLAGSMLLIIPALAYFLPGATLTTGMFELASGDLISGSSRVIYGITILFLLLFGVLNGFKIIGLPQEDLLVVTAANTLGWWAPYIGIMLFGIGMFLFLSMRNRDFPWVMIVLYVAFLGQSLGNYFIGGFFGAFFGSLLMTISGTLIGRSPMRTPSFVSTLSAFWLLVPGSLGFISLANLIGPNYSSGIADVIQVIMSVVAISLGLLIGAVIAEPLKLQKIKLKKFKK